MKVVGKNVTKIDAFKLARGEPVFTDDFTRQGMLYAKVLRSSFGTGTSRPFPIRGQARVIRNRHRTTP